MSETDKVFAGSIPENYDRYLVPLVFESFGPRYCTTIASPLDVIIRPPFGKRANCDRFLEFRSAAQVDRTRLHPH